MAEAKLVLPDGRLPQFELPQEKYSTAQIRCLELYIYDFPRGHVISRSSTSFVSTNILDAESIVLQILQVNACTFSTTFSGSFDHLECANVQYTLSGNFHCCCCSSWHSRYVKAAMDGPHRLHLRKERYNAYYTFFYCSSASSDRKTLSPCISSWSISPMLVSLIISSARTCLNDERKIPEASASLFSQSNPPIRLFHTNSQFA